MLIKRCGGIALKGQCQVEKYRSLPLCLQTLSFLIPHLQDRLAKMGMDGQYSEQKKNCIDSFWSCLKLLIIWKTNLYQTQLSPQVTVHAAHELLNLKTAIKSKRSAVISATYKSALRRGACFLLIIVN